MFINARPIWLKDKENEMNVAAVFTETVGSLLGTEIHIAACTFYRIYVNGKFVAFGPARTAGGYARVDVIPLSEYNRGDKNTVRIEVVAYNCRAFSTCIGKGFLTAEIRRGDEIIAYTGRDFSAARITAKEQKVERYSIQRHFTEIWDFTNEETPCETVITEYTPKYLKRRAPYPLYNDVLAGNALVCGEFTDSGIEPERPIRHSWNPAPKYWGGFKQDEIERKPFRFVMRQVQNVKEKNVSLPLTLNAGEYAIFDMKQIECGFIRLTGKTAAESDVVIAYSEYFEGDKFDYSGISCHNAIECIFKEGWSGEFLSFEPYTVRFAIVMVKSGALSLSSFGVKTYEHDMSKAKEKEFPSKKHNGIYNAALRTFAHNAVDIYTDCPSRERAGWLCDSYFTAYAENYFFGEVPVEADFLENFTLCSSPELPRGLVPMSFPADVRVRDIAGGTEHIPQWCMWYVLEVKEYITERNKGADRELYRQSVESLLDYLETFENSDGLLEDLPSWNFVEWSKANDWTKNVNYPTNFLYAATLDAAAELYGRQSYKKKAKRVREKAIEQSFDGELFTDNAVRDGAGVLKNTGNVSEICQYYAYAFCDIDLNDEKYAKYREHFLSGCKDTGRTVEPINAFIGLYMRMKALLKAKEYRLLLDEVEGFFGEMADLTGTLWELRTPTSSLDHGFASYVAYAMCVAIDNL